MPNPTPYPSNGRDEPVAEITAIAILQQTPRRTDLFVGTPLAPYAQGLTQKATTWRRTLEPAAALRYAMVSAVEDAMTAFRAWVPLDTLAGHAMAAIQERPEEAPPVRRLFAIDALWAKWSLLQHGTDRFAVPATKEAMLVLGEGKILRQWIHEAVGHVEKALRAKELTLPSAAAELVEPLFREHLPTLTEALAAHWSLDSPPALASTASAPSR